MNKKNFIGRRILKAQIQMERELKAIDKRQEKGYYNLQDEYQKVRNALQIQADGTKCWSF